MPRLATSAIEGEEPSVIIPTRLPQLSRGFGISQRRRIDDKWSIYISTGIALASHKSGLDHSLLVSSWLPTTKVIDTNEPCEDT